jgi:hypothetical protein
MCVLNFEIVVQEEGKSIPPEYVTVITITISYKEKTMVVHIASKSLDKLISLCSANPAFNSFFY